MLLNISSAELSAITSEEELFCKRDVITELIKGAACSKDPQAAFEFLSNDELIKNFLGSDKTQWPTRARDLYNSIEGFGTDFSKAAARVIPAGAVTGTGYAAALSSLLGLPASWSIAVTAVYTVYGALVAFAYLGIAAIIYSCVVRLTRYKKMIEESLVVGLDQDRIYKAYSEYLPVYKEFSFKVNRIENLKALSEYIAKNVHNLDVAKLSYRFSKLGLLISNDGKVTAGAHVDWSQTDNTDSAAGKGWDAKKLTTACNSMLSLIKSVGHLQITKDNVQGQVSKASIKLLRGSIKELNFWLLDLTRGVAVASKACRYK